jgi:UDP-2,3-diacylglucosamine pyrophosphatase LpxH
MIVVVSDLHLGHSSETIDKEGFRIFIEKYLMKNKVEHLIMLGDMVDFWRRQKEGVLLENLEILADLKKLRANGTKIHYVVGNHDYSLTELMGERYEKSIGFRFSDVLVTSEDRRNSTEEHIVCDPSIKLGDQDYMFMHGHQLTYWLVGPLYRNFAKLMCSAGDEVGQSASKFYDLVMHRFPESASKQVDWFRSEIEGAADYELTSEPDKRSVIPVLKIAQGLTYKDQEDEQKRSTTWLENKIDGINDTTLQKAFKKKWQDFAHPKTFTHDLKRLVAKELFRLQKDEYLIFGHTHKPFLDKRRKMANVGCWYRGNCTFLTIDKDDEVNLFNWEKKGKNYEKKPA